MLLVDANLRPSCKDILDYDSVQKQAHKLGINIENDFRDGFKASGRFGDSEEDV